MTYIIPGVGTPAIGDAIGSGVAGSALFLGAAGVLAQNNASYKWTDADTELKLTAGAATKTPLKIVAAPAQTADLSDIFASDGTTKLHHITAAGAVHAPNFVANATLSNAFQVFAGYSMGVGSGSLLFSVPSAARFDFSVAGIGIVADIDDNAAAGNTRLRIWDVDNGQLERVSVGAADSGGVGFKVLRIPN